MVVVQKFSTMETVCLDLNDDPLARLTTIPNRMMLMAYNLLPEPER